MAEEITYIPYGLNEISQLDLMTNLANGLPSFMQQYKWLLKPKNLEKFLLAYEDITKNLVGASDSTGRWVVNANNIDISGMSPKDREIYEHAAYYIQLLMSLMTPRTKEEEKKNENLDKFDFIKSFNQLLLNNYYGGNLTLFADSEQGWNALDARGSNGLRGTDKRRERMIEALESYKKGLEGKNFNFEGTSFTDINDANTKILAAIDALKTSGEEDDLKAFSALGLPYRSYFSNGGNDPYTKGNYSGTYLGYNDYLEELKQAKLKAELEKLKAQRANQYDNYKYYNFLNGTPSNAQDFEGIVGKLSNQQALDGNDISRISWAFRQAEKAGGLVNLSKEELDKMPRYASTPGRLKKLQSGLDGIYYDTFSKRLVQPQKNSQLLGVTLLSILDLNNPELLELKRLELQNFKKLKDEDWDIITADTVSMLGDLVSLGGGYAGAAGGATTILSDLYADLRRGKNFWDVTKNLAKNTAWGFAGLIPGVKLAKLGKRAALLYALYNSWGIITDPDVHKSWKKLINGEDFTSHDFENLKWTLHAVTGAHNTARSHFSDNALLKKLGTKNKVVVETKNGKRTITTEQQNEINKAGGRGGQEAANKKFLEYAKAEAKEGSFEFNSEGRKWYNPTRYSQKLRNAISNETKLNGTPTGASKMTIGRMLVLDRNKPIIANPFSSSTYKNWWTSGGPNRGYTTMALGKMYLNLNNTKQNIVSSTEPLSELQSNGNKKTWAEIEKGPKKWSQSTEAKEYKEMLKGNYTNNAIQGGTHKIGDLTINVDIPRPGATNGFAEVTFSNGNKQTIRFDNLRQLQELIAKIVKERRVQIDSSGKKTKVDVKEMSKILKSLKARGFLKQGGQINSLDKIIEDFINNNNI